MRDHNNVLKLWHFTDLHLFAREPMPAEEPYYDQITMRFSCEIIDQGLAMFLAEPNCDILLLSGDITCNGHAQEHKALIPRLRRVQQAGKRVLVVTGTHEYGQTKAQEHNGTGLPPLEHPEGKVFRHELAGLYEEFGPRDAIARYEPDNGMSYVAQLAPGYRLLCLNCDRASRTFCDFDEDHMQWIFAQLTEAKQAGETVFGMTHHPTLPPTPIYPILTQFDTQGGWETCTPRLADAGLRAMLTGHTHMMNIEPLITAAGNRYWDINTSALVGYPGAFRVIELEGRRMKVSVRHMDDLGFDTGGLGAKEYLARHFDYLLRGVVESAANDIESLANYSGEFGVNGKYIRQYRLPITLVGKYINRATLGSVARLLLCRIPKEAKKVSAKELFLECVRNIYGGEEHYAPDTPVGEALLAMAGRVEWLLRRKLRGTPVEGLRELLGSVVYDPTPDYDLEIEL